MKQLRLHTLVGLCALVLACGTPGSRDTGRISIAVVPFGVSAGSAPPVDVAHLIRADLASSGRFAPMTPADMPSRPTRLSEIQFDEWRGATEYLVVGRVARVHDGGHEVEFRLLDTRAETSLVGFLVPSAPDELDQTALQISKLIDERLSARP